ncbi:MAG TPA: alpha/beta hydrolase [Albitalea sp.]|nr:alpha/beta hydrolase [Albitalea sp.]
MRRSIVVAALAAVAWSAWPPGAFAGPIRDRLMERAAQRREAARSPDAASGVSSDADELEQASGRQGAGPLPPGVRVERDLAYGPDPAQKLDVYRPAHAQGAPVILTVHGGGWVHGDKAMGRIVTNKVAHWVPQGKIVISINYRMAEADPLQEADDVARALAFAQAHAADWGGDPARFTLMGHSAGAHLVSLLSADPSIATRQGAKPWRGTVALDSAAFDVTAIMQARHYRLYDRAFKSDPALWREASPLLRLHAAPVPMLLVCSTRRADSCAQAGAFAAKAKGLGGRIEQLPQDLSHAQINEQLGQAGAYTDAVDAFLRSLGNK